MHKFIFFIDSRSPGHCLSDACLHIATCPHPHDCGEGVYEGIWWEVEATDEDEAMEIFTGSHKKWGAPWHIYTPCVALHLRGRHIVATPELDCREDIKC